MIIQSSLPVLGQTCITGAISSSRITVFLTIRRFTFYKKKQASKKTKRNIFLKERITLW